MMKLMKKVVILVLLLLAIFSISSRKTIFAQTAAEPIICGCPTELTKIYENLNSGERCVNDYATFKQDPARNHLWVEDSSITTQGKADDRARQFIYWTITHTSIDNHPVLIKVWSAARNIAYFLVLIVGAIMGLSIIINQRSNFSSSIKVWPSVWKILLILLYISLSATIVITLIQLSEIIMKFFIESLGGKDLFNIYFAPLPQSGAQTAQDLSSEANYLQFVGCRDLNIRVQEAVGAELILLKLTNISYYVMGGMLILRKILLWFLLFVSPFLGILMPFVFIRNIGWIWIGVFMQWIFYGPLLALFLGGLATVWKAGIPFIFDFSRVGSSQGYIYPTAINILYGGPAQKLAIVNNGNYIDTFAEYVITLIMLWAVTFFPWWLLRIFRDYCCDAINASKNILMSMYDQMRGGQSPTPGPAPQPVSTNIGTSMKIPRDTDIKIQVKLETMEQIKKTKTEDITRSLNVKASTLTDVARYDTSKELRQTVNKNLNYLKNPTQAETATERQKFMNIRTELFNRAVKEDHTAKQLLTSLSSSKVEQVTQRQELLRSISQMAPVTRLEAIKVKTATIQVEGTPSIAPSDKTTEIKAQTTKIKIGQTADHVTIEKEAADMAKKPSEKAIEESIQIPPTVSIEEYEQVKRMWKEQYEKGEVPTTENITSRSVWLDNDIVFITNTLNKLFSTDDQVKQAGLDDVGYILPIFLVNNLKGDQLVTYLKAKIEAAKEVREMKEKEKEITDKLKAEDKVEELVEAAKPKEQAAEKEMEMKKELPSDK